MLRILLLLSVVVLFAGCETIPPQNGAGQTVQQSTADCADPLAARSDWLHGFWDGTPKEYHLATQ